MREVLRNRPPVRLCCGERHWSVACPDGKVMCCLCFDRFPQDELHVDADGQKWDVCKSCQHGEDEARRVVRDAD